MTYLQTPYDLSVAIDSLEKETARHNNTFDEANTIFSNVESVLSETNVDYWYPYSLFPKIYHTSEHQSVAPTYTLQPFSVISYILGYTTYKNSRRLIIKKVVSNYDYTRDAYGNVVFAPNYAPYTNKVDEEIGDTITVADSSREVRVMVIEHLPAFIEYARASIEVHTQTLNSALESLRAE